MSAGLFDIRIIAVSLGTFLGGCYLIGQLGNLLGPQRRLCVLFSNLWSTAMVYAAAAVQWSFISTHTRTTALVTISLLGLSLGA
ncbi:hypothetical protein GGS20DRAFT_569150 [Poronia punctata]|nr:hypothetical protein GGS20DRAFT_569150 [Poronia punctata]